MCEESIQFFFCFVGIENVSVLRNTKPGWETNILRRKNGRVAIYTEMQSSEVGILWYSLAVWRTGGEPGGKNGRRMGVTRLSTSKARDEKRVRVRVMLMISS